MPSGVGVTGGLVRTFEDERGAGSVGGRYVKRDRLVRLGALGSLLLAFGLIATVLAPVAAADDWSPPSTVWVQDAGHTVDGLFLDDWRAYQTLYGQPISEELKTKVALGDAKASTYTVQYFENLAIAYVPEAKKDDWKVQALGLGAEALQADQAKLAKLNLPSKGSCSGLTKETCAKFAENGHSVRMGFKEFWDANDGERLLGVPLTEEFVGADKVTTQYFEHAVLQWTKKDGVTVRPIGSETAKRLKVKTAKIAQPEDVPVYDEELFVEPAGVGGYDLGSGPGPQQGGYKEIVVSISTESMWAYEDGDLVISSLVSTGIGDVPETVTPLGDWAIWEKLDSQTMEGTISGQYYRVPDVPYVMYFDDRGDALHGTYWHNNFGNPMSHGCVNLPMDVAAFLYDWADVGTPVTIIE
jgi:hypothetical protein